MELVFPVYITAAYIRTLAKFIGGGGACNAPSNNIIAHKESILAKKYNCPTKVN